MHSHVGLWVATHYCSFLSTDTSPPIQVIGKYTGGSTSPANFEKVQLKNLNLATGQYDLRWEIVKDQGGGTVFNTVGGGDISPHDGVLYVPMRVDGDNGDTTVTRSLI